MRQLFDLQAVVIYGWGALAAQSSSANHTELETCLSSLSFPVVLPTSPDYALASRAYNRRLSYHPSAIVYPSTPAQVSQSILCASRSRTPVVARSGGHSAAAFSLGGKDGSLVVDLAGLYGVVWEDEEGLRVRVGTGLRLKGLGKALRKKGRALPHGTCPSVGVGGHAAFGGFGFTSREWGLLLDRIVEAEVVLADERLVNASLEENEDLFWAVRGSAPSFGIVTSYTFSTLPVLYTTIKPPVTTAYSYVFAGNASSAAQCFLAFQDFASNHAPPPLGMQFSLIPDQTYELFGSYTGPLSSFEDIFLPLVRECESTSDQDSGTHAWAQELGWEAHLVSQAGTPPRVADCFYAKSLMTSDRTLLSSETVERFMHHLWDETPKVRLAWFVEVDVYGGKGSAINGLPAGGRAFRYRDRLLGFHVKASSRDLRPPYPAEEIPFVEGLARALSEGEEGASFKAYGSYVDPRLEEWEEMYYGEEIYGRLRVLKELWDPTGLFGFPQAIAGDGKVGRTRDEL
ncbi:FAD-binding domain-containing protein [Dacryopinax primogenitus]|uniref:FAD-binding domain-containing protein n=1 Tax=Dacryopinax primogenitus (strain DJM 731) TaxID=1858805 RepID=M5FUV0_DACPD|nr:FAD-binding domain-containing protein [Dacryopinax primogenitus]EJU00034.1 FAD-binding domain-containing protein [Dacryopinax primogenitus]